MIAAATRSGQVPLPDGGALYYEVDGDPAARPLLLVRPLGGSLALWADLRAHLSAGVQVVAFDPRGAGRSSAPPLLTTTRQMARDAVALLDGLRLDAADVFGLSLGGMVAQWLALDAPGRVRRLVLASTVPRGLDISPEGALRGLALSRCLLNPPRQAEVCLVQRVLSDSFRLEHPDQVARILAIVRAQPASTRGLLAQIAALAGHDTRALVGRIAAPTLVLAGTRDQLLDHDAQRQLAAAIPGARFQALPGSGHDLSLEVPAACAAQLLSFVLSAQTP